MDMGINGFGPYGGWLQVTHKGDLSNEYPLILQPNGSYVGIGTNAPASALEVRDAGDSNIYSGTLSIWANNKTQGIGIGYSGISKLASTTDGSLYIDAKGAAHLILQNNATGHVGVGITTPGLPLDVRGTPGAPAVSGATQTNGSLRLGTDTGNSQVLDMGISNDSPYGAWLQAANGGDLSGNSPLVLNPNGGNVGIGTNDPGSYKCYINGTGYLASIAWVYSSDERLKENVSRIPSGLDVIGELAPVTFDYINGEKQQAGFIAQEVRDVLPDIVTAGPDGMLGMKTNSIIPYLVKAIQDQQGQMENKQTEIEVLKAQNAEIMSRLEALEVR